MDRLRMVADGRPVRRGGEWLLGGGRSSSSSRVLNKNTDTSVWRAYDDEDDDDDWLWFQWQMAEKR